MDNEQKNENIQDLLKKQMDLQKWMLFAQGLQTFFVVGFICFIMYFALGQLFH